MLNPFDPAPAPTFLSSVLCRYSTFYALPPFFQVFVETFVVVFAAVDIAYVSEPQASVHIPFAFVVLIPACALVFEEDIPEPPRSFVLPKIFSSANSSSSAEVADKEFARNSSRVHTNYGCGSKFSSVGLR